MITYIMILSLYRNYPATQQAVFATEDLCLSAGIKAQETLSPFYKVDFVCLKNEWNNK